MSDLFERAATLGVEPLVRALLGCEWGPEAIHTKDDDANCPERAVQIVVLHGDDAMREVKLCQRHVDRVMAETDPHEGTGLDDEHPADCQFCAAGEGQRHNYEPPSGT